MTDTTVRDQLAWIERLSDQLSQEILGLPPDRWDHQTNCAPWHVRDLAAHVVSSGEGFVLSVRRGLAGSAEPTGPPDARRRRQDELAGTDPRTVVAALRAATVEFAGLYQGLTDDQLSAVCFHRRGPRSVRWYAAHRLAEVAFHRWDLLFSVGPQTPELDEEVAALLLPTLIESNAPSSYTAGQTPERGAGERYLLAVAGEPRARWLVTIDPEELRVRASPDGGSAGLSITGSAAAIALLVYGRRELADLEACGAVHVEGDPTRLQRFAATFPKP
jgi:uncharacterized protein (TIGR03083 family)